MAKVPRMGVLGDHTLFTRRTERGATISADASLVAESPAAATYLAQQALDILVAGHRLNVTITGGPLAGICQVLRAALESAGTAADRLGLVVDGSTLSPQDAWQIRCTELGRGPLFVIPGGAAGPSIWAALWELRAEQHVRVVCSGEVTSPCRLLAAEPADAVIPGTEILAPVASAWSTESLHLPDFNDGGGEVDEDALLAAARRAVAAADSRHAIQQWPTPRMRYDGWLNRRLGIELTGVGELVQRRDGDPAAFASLDELSGLLTRVRAALVQRSRELAAEYGHLAALDQPREMPLIRDAQLREGWMRRWRHTIEATALRNRNLLVISPWSLFPGRDRADARYTNLLPLLRHADACSWPPPPNLSHWGRTDFGNFYRRVGAVLQQRSTQCQIAEPA